MKLIFLTTFMFGMGVLANGDTNISPRSFFKDALNPFSSALYKELSKTHPGNKIFSPFVSHLGLFMLCNGAQGQTLNEFNSVLRMICNDRLFRDEYKSTLENLLSENATLNIAAKIFTSSNTSVVPKYESEMNTLFNSSVDSVDFSQAENAANVINKFVDDLTRHKISELVGKDTIESDTAMILVTAIYFNSSWKYPFHSSLTSNGTFKNGNVTKQVPFMQIVEEFIHGTVNNLNARFVKLPYEGGKFSMVIFLPDEGHKLEDLEQSFSNLTIEDVLSSGRESEVKLSLPKFDFESTFEMDQALQKMGIRDAYTPKSNFSGLTTSAVQLEKSIHKAVITVNETGTVAAAASAYNIAFMSLPDMPESFVVDRPFMFMIMYEPAGMQLFVGSVYSP